jgi:hypothetical protein
VDEQNATGTTDASTSIESMLVGFGVAKQADLADRTAARSDLRALRTLAGDTWTVPGAVTEPMRDWTFGPARSAIATTSTIIDDVTATAAALPVVTVEANPIRTQLAAADSSLDLHAVQMDAHGQRGTAEAVAAAVARTEHLSPVDAIGLIGNDLDRVSASAVDKVALMDLDGAQADTAAIDASLQGSTTSGAIRIALAAVAIFAIVAAAWLSRRRRGSRATVSLLTASATSATGSTDPNASSTLDEAPGI